MSSNVKEFVSWLGIIGIPSLFTIIVALIKWVKKVWSQIIVLQRAQKAQMRSQLLAQYRLYIDANYISDEDLDDWVNQYKEYHTLVGDNEVLDSKKTALISLNNQSNANTNI